jgi:predicted anti-sigma-YlaC factor YlaD
MRACEAASARLDGELGELDAVRLEQHLQGCAPCRAFAADVAGLGAALRNSALEPAPAGLFVANRRPRRIAAPVAVAAATLVVAVAAGASFFVGELVGGHGSTPTLRTATAAQKKLDPGLVAMLGGTARPRAQTGKVIAL